MNSEPALDPRVEDRARVRLFERHRGRLRGIAYRMLGSVSDAEDIVQEAYLRYAPLPKPSPPWRRLEIAADPREEGSEEELVRLTVGIGLINTPESARDRLALHPSNRRAQGGRDPFQGEPRPCGSIIVSASA